MSQSPTSDESSAKPSGKSTSDGSAAPSPVTPGEQPAPGQLTKEEQWALFEKELKESDWGHQPC
jgi:hypothetical protein